MQLELELQGQFLDVHLCDELNVFVPLPPHDGIKRHQRYELTCSPPSKENEETHLTRNQTVGTLISDF